MADIQDDLVSALEHKNPKVKVETLKLIEGFVASASKPNAAKVHSSVLPAAAKSANEAAPDIREAALAVLVAFGLKAGSVSVLNKVTDKLDDSRKKKLEDMVQQATTGGLPSRAPASATASPRRSPASSPGSSRPSSARVCHCQGLLYTIFCMHQLLPVSTGAFPLVAYRRNPVCAC